jgi:fructose-1,6-bisphosphatase/inositol monophosphatase family enzyme
MPTQGNPRRELGNRRLWLWTAAVVKVSCVGVAAQDLAGVAAGTDS